MTLRKKNAHVRIPALAALVFTLVLSGCFSVLDPGDPPIRLQLRPAMPGHLGGKPVNRQIAVALPQAGQDTDSDNVMLLFNGRELRSLAGVRWSDSAPSMVQRNLVDALEASGALRGVGDDSSGLNADARLLTEIRDFSLHYTDEKNAPTAVLEATFRVLSLQSGKVLGSRAVTAQSQATGTDNKALVGAMENALGDAIAQVTPWAVGLVRKM